MHSLKAPTRRLVSQQEAAIIEAAHIPRSRFLNRWTRTTAFDQGYLVPFMVEEILPGDHMKYNIIAYVRVDTLLFPIFGQLRLDTFIFYVPSRILWTNFVRMMGEQTNPSDTIAYTCPVMTVNNLDVGSIFDHMGLQTTGQTTNSHDVNALPFRAYNKIYNAWFRDENIINTVTENTGDTGDDTADYQMQKRAKAHDYFTSALPWAQKFTAPATPLSGTAPVKGIGIAGGTATTNVSANFFETPGGAAVAYPNYYDFGPAIAADKYAIKADGSQGNLQIFADLSQATGVTINAFRQAFMIQALLERDARGGTRYVELLKSHFGVTSPDFRLQRPEYIGGGQSTLNVTPIAQTAPTTGVPLGALGAAGTSAGQHRASYAATEHGYIIGLINVRSELKYQQGLHRMYTRSTRYDFYWPALALMGEQAVLRGEIYKTGASANDNVVFGYQPRWEEYRQRYSDVTGIMKSTAASTLDAWHTGQKFTSAPTLSQTFIEDTAPMSRLLAAGTAANGQQFRAEILIERDAVRPIPLHGTPALLGRF